MCAVQILRNVANKMFSSLYVNKTDLRELLLIDQSDRDIHVTSIE